MGGVGFHAILAEKEQEEKERALILQKEEEEKKQKELAQDPYYVIGRFIINVFKGIWNILFSSIKWFLLAIAGMVVGVLWMLFENIILPFGFLALLVWGIWGLIKIFS